MTSDDPRSAREWPAGTQTARWPMADGWQVRVADMPARGGAENGLADSPDSGREGRAIGVIVHAGGRGDFIEKALESFHHWTLSGWRVVAFDWRGQGGSGREPSAAGVGHIDDFAVWVADLAAIVARAGDGEPGPVVVVGHSMGGHLVLRALVDGKLECDGAVLVASMLGFTGPVPVSVGAAVAGLLARVRRHAAALRGGEKPGAGGAGFRQRLLTQDDRRYADEQWWLARAPELATGPGSWGWVAAAYRSMAVTRDRARLARVDTPILALSADADALVDATAGREALAALPDCRLVRYPAPARHELLREVDAVRGPVLAEIDEFLARIAAP